MKLQKNSRIFNLGDTSFRREKLLEDYTELLRILEKSNKEYEEWDNEAQSAFYIMVFNETTLLESDKLAKNSAQRGRTMSNPLQKIGLTDNKRNITDIGKDLLNLDKEKASFEVDKLEKNLNISKKNILFLRQLLKFKIFNHNEEYSFNPFLVIILMLVKYNYLEIEHFKQIVQHLYFRQDYKGIVNNYENVKKGSMTFEDYLDENILTDIEDESIETNIINEFEENGEYFRENFPNRKTAKSVDLYEKYYELLIQVRKDIKNEKENMENVKRLLEVMRNNKIRTAFLSNEVFEIPRKSSKDYETFLEDNKNNDFFIWNDVKFRKELRKFFWLGKFTALLNDYYDVTRRTFNLTGVIDFSNGRVKLSKKYLLDILEEFPEKIYGLLESDEFDSIEEYYSYFYSNEKSILKILDFKEAEIEEYHEKMMVKTEISDIEGLDKYYFELEEREFKRFIDDKFTNQDIVEILQNIRERNDEAVYEKVTDSASISTIFEYISGIAWYRISKSYEDYSVLSSLKLSLDGSFLPLSHATGGDGDIVINYKDHTLMLEVTLMDLSNQRRNELEPVIRHATNLTIDNKDKPVYTIFIANKVDYNVSNILRLCSYINLKSTAGFEEYTENGVQISSLEIDNIIKYLNMDISYEKIYEVLSQEFEYDEISIIDNNWRQKFLDKTLEK